MPTIAGFPRESFLRRRERVFDVLGDDAMVLPSAPALVRAGDSELRYRADSELFYLSGCEEPDTLLLLRGHADSDRAILFVRDRDPLAEQWSGPRWGPDGARERLGIESVFPIEALEHRFPELLAGAARIHFRLGRDPRSERLVIDALRKARATGAREGKGPRGVIDPGEILDELRLRKDPEEVEALREAAAVTVAAFRDAIRETGPGMGEWEVEALVESGFRRRGARGPAFATIAASGPNACVLHHVANDRRVGSGELVLLDAGAEVRCYAGDVTRTFPADGKFSPAQRDVYEVVEAARSRAVDAVRPGTTIQEVHHVVVRALTEGLVQLGVLSGSVDDLVEGAACRPWFPHRTSHWLGLDTHDPGDYRVKERDRVLEPGMVLTVEPGLYFPGGDRAGDAPTPPRLGGIGIRIEDDLLVTDEGAELLTAGLPTDPDGVAAMAGEAGT